MRRLIVGLAALATLAASCGGEQQATPDASPSPEAAQEIDVTAVDYAFEGVPETVEPGEVTFVLTNEGDVSHEMAFGRLIGDKSIEEVVQLPEAQLGEEIERIEEGIQPIQPGDTGEVTLDFEPGRYAYVCFVAEGTGHPHAFEGMLGEFTVE